MYGPYLRQALHNFYRPVELGIYELRVHGPKNLEREIVKREIVKREIVNGKKDQTTTVGRRMYVQQDRQNTELNSTSPEARGGDLRVQCVAIKTVVFFENLPKSTVLAGFSANLGSIRP